MNIIQVVVFEMDDASQRDEHVVGVRCAMCDVRAG